jgi:RNAse (barnase) inhibitor barstar
MKVPDLASLDDAGVHPWAGAAEPLKTAAAHAHLKYAAVDLAHAKDRATLFAELDRALALPEHFGHNFDALADVLEDRDWLGKSGHVIALLHTAAYRRDHPNDWATLEELLAEAAEFWKELHLGFWIFVA